MNKKTQRLISEELLEAVLRYLISRPMAEVEGAVAALRALPTAPEPAPVKKDDPKAAK